MDTQNKCDEAGCFHRLPDMRDDGKGGQLYCYMFKDPPENLPCAQLTEDGRPPKTRITPEVALNWKLDFLERNRAGKNMVAV